jgi:hypothetical protein
MTLQGTSSEYEWIDASGTRHHDTWETRDPFAQDGDDDELEDDDYDEDDVDEEDEEEEDDL